MACTIIGYIKIEKAFSLTEEASFDKVDLFKSIYL